MKVFPETPHLNMVPREVPLEPKRVISVFRERVEKHKDELAELQEQEKLIEKEKPVSVLNVTYYLHSSIELKYNVVYNDITGTNKNASLKPIIVIIGYVFTKQNEG